MNGELKFVQTSLTDSNQRLHVAIAGPREAQPLLLVHGFPLDHSMWCEQIRRFSNDRFVIAPDLRGFGRSALTHDADTSADDSASIPMWRFADDLAEALAQLEVDRPVDFCGLSMGGYIGWQLCARHRARIRRVVLCDTKAAADSDNMKTVRRQTAARVLREGPGFLAEAMADRLFSQATRVRRPEIVASTQDVIRATSRHTIAAALKGMADREDATPSLASFDLPALLIVGEHDEISPPEEMRRMADAMPDAKFVSIAGAGHMAPLECPAAVNSALAEFFETT